MKRFALLLLVTSAAIAANAPAWLVDPVAQVRTGIDTNPLASNSATPALDDSESVVISSSVGFGVLLPGQAKATPTKLTYFGETVRFEDRLDENYTSHRLALAAQAVFSGWKISADGSALLIDGNREALPSLSASNANATSLWRERRAQIQYRAKFLALHDTDHMRVRVSGTLLDYDYYTRIQSGRATFSDRGDMFAGADMGWKPSARSWWFGGVRVGAQHQDTVPLPGGGFDYSSRYVRVIAGWEGRLGENTTLAFAAGPDFRHYSGTIDERVFRGRDRTFGWFETALTTKLSPQWTLTAKAARWTWLSSTGKSALTDLGGEVQLAWTPTTTWSLRASAKIHQCSYFPVVRNDWEYLGSLGVTYKVTKRWQLSADLLDHRGWNELRHATDREFDRAVVMLGASVKL
jgi:hypothetical protein